MGAAAPAPEAAVDRVRKLLALSESGNANEAAAAAAAAQRLMEQHGIDAAMLDVDEDAEPDEPVDEHHVGDEGRRVAMWRNALSYALASANGCKSVLRKQRRGPTKLVLIGRASDAAVVRYMYQYLTSEIDRLCDAEAHSRGRAGKTWRNSFRLGAVDVITERLEEAKQAARDERRAEAGGGAALVRVDKAIARLDARLSEAEAWAKHNLRLRKGGRSRWRQDPEAYAAGGEAGKRIRLDRGGPGLPSSGSGGGSLPR